ncbi:predicted protein [Chaetoceros tenuissimus]|uniref:Uncharacterized protein n=1 Tax=Chaetoceros tenuissimus TaxID=426638 RepID=A0AAD3DA71_9STRA|nr:predicted protein [Chaetoceros tenuissimus]
MKSLRGYMNDLRRKVNDVMMENEVLEYRAEYFRERLKRMDPFEQQSINLKSEDIVQLVEIMNEQAIVKQKIENLAHESVYQQMISTVLRESKSNDLMIKPKEFRHILIRLEYQSGLYFHKDKFVRLLRKSCKEDDDIPVETIASILRDYHDSQKVIRSSRRIFSSNIIDIKERNEVRKQAKRTLIFKRRK